VGVLAVAAAAVSDERCGGVETLLGKGEELPVEVGLPHRERSGAADVALAINVRAAGVEERRSAVEERLRLLRRDFEIRLVGMRRKIGRRGGDRGRRGRDGRFRNGGAPADPVEAPLRAGRQIRHRGENEREAREDRRLPDKSPIRQFFFHKRT
jgi:hypothetical protein